MGICTSEVSALVMGDGIWLTVNSKGQWGLTVSFVQIREDLPHKQFIYRPSFLNRLHLISLLVMSVDEAR